MDWSPVMNLTELFELATRRKASDLHFASGEPPRLRIDGELVPLEETADMTALLDPFLTPDGNARLAAGLPVERTLVHGEFAFVGIAFRTSDAGIAATFRILPKAIPPFERIMEGAEPFFRGIADARRGLVLIVGPVGSGKWTTAGALVDTINAERSVRIFVATTHPGFLFESKRGMVTQVRVGQGESLAATLRLFQEADPDIVAMDDLPTHEDLRQALALADTGHLVIANLHADSPAQAILRLVESAGEEAPALRRALAENLLAVTAQRLLPRVGGGRIPVYEWIANGPAVKEALLSGGDLEGIQASDPGSRTLAPTVRDLYMSGRISLEDAVQAVPPEQMDPIKLALKSAEKG